MREEHAGLCKCMCVGKSDGQRGFPSGSVVRNPPAMQETRVQSLTQEDPTCH